MNTHCQTSGFSQLVVLYTQSGSIWRCPARTTLRSREVPHRAVTVPFLVTCVSDVCGREFQVLKSSVNHTPDEFLTVRWILFPLGCRCVSDQETPGNPLTVFSGVGGHLQQTAQVCLFLLAVDLLLTSLPVRSEHVFLFSFTSKRSSSLIG